MKYLIIGLFFTALGIVIGITYATTKTILQINRKFETPTPIHIRESTLTQSVRTAKLEKTLNKYHSPMASQSALLVGIADYYQLDYRLLPAIAYTESTLCRFYITSTHNCLGYGSGRLNFSSYEQAEYTVAKTLSRGRAYFAWRSNPGSIMQLGKTYNGSDYRGWSTIVANFMDEIERN